MCVQTNSDDRKLDSLYLKLFKYVVLMTLRSSLSWYWCRWQRSSSFKRRRRCAPAAAPPQKAVDLEDFKNYLIREEKRRLEQEKNGGVAVGSKQAVSAPVVSSLYGTLIGHTAMFQKFRENARLEVSNASETELSQAREAPEGEHRTPGQQPVSGPSWPDAMQSFVCGVLTNPVIAKLRQDNLIGTVVSPANQFFMPPHGLQSSATKPNSCQGRKPSIRRQEEAEALR